MQAVIEYSVIFGSVTWYRVLLSVLVNVSNIDR